MHFLDQIGDGQHGSGDHTPTSTLRSSLAAPAMVAIAGDRAARRFLEFFPASIENDNTRMAYYWAVCSFFAWLEEHGIGELPDIEPFHFAAYLKALRVADAGDRTTRERIAARPTVKQHLAGNPHAVRLARRRPNAPMLAINPAHAVREPKHVVKRGETPLLSSALGQTGTLTDRPMHSIDAYQMVRRRTAAAGLNGKLGCHVFRATGITTYLEAGGSLENAEAMTAHESRRTTKLYDPHRRRDHPRRG